MRGSFLLGRVQAKIWILLAAQMWQRQLQTWRSFWCCQIWSMSGCKSLCDARGQQEFLIVKGDDGVVWRELRKRWWCWMMSIWEFDWKQMVAATFVDDTKVSTTKVMTTTRTTTVLGRAHNNHNNSGTERRDPHRIAKEQQFSFYLWMCSSFHVFRLIICWHHCQSRQGGKNQVSLRSPRKSPQLESIV